jgi:hypothetical protein
MRARSSSGDGIPWRDGGGGSNRWWWWGQMRVATSAVWQPIASILSGVVVGWWSLGGRQGGGLAGWRGAVHFPGSSG